MMKLFAFKTLGIAIVAAAGFFASPDAQAQRRDDDWVLCANEGQICRVNGRTEVAFGARGYYVYGVARGSFRCDVQTFGRDPIPGVRKQCFARQDRRDDPGRRRWVYCAREGSICRVPGDAIVRYGANGYWNRLRVRGSVWCNNRTFGDPIRGVEKRCEYRLLR